MANVLELQNVRKAFGSEVVAVGVSAAKDVTGLRSPMNTKPATASTCLRFFIYSSFSD